MAFSLPGLGLEDSPTPAHASLHQPSTASIPTSTTTHTLEKQTEYRLEIPTTTTITIKLLTGSAEIFGTELVIGNTSTIPGPAKLAIYTWQGCTFEITAPEDFPGGYLADETPMHEYLNTHLALEGLRGSPDSSPDTTKLGPRVLILGPSDSGKTSLVKTLTAYAIRSAASPVVVNLDPREGMLSVPGTLTAAVFKSQLDVEEGWGCAPMSAPTGIVPAKLPLVYYYGSDRVEDTPATSGQSAQNPHRPSILYRSLVTRLALAVAGRVAGDSEARGSGVILDTPGSLANPRNVNLVSHMVSEFSINCIICLGSERLYSDVVKRFDGTAVATSSLVSPSATGVNSLNDSSADRISVIRLTKSGGTSERDPQFHRDHRAQQVHRYFYGDDRLASLGQVKLSPRVLTVDWASLAVWQLVSFEASTSDSANTGARNGGGSGIPGFTAAADDDDIDFLPGDADERDFIPSQHNDTHSSVPIPPSQLFTRLSTSSSTSSSLNRYAGHLLAILNCPPDPATQAEIRDSSVMGFLLIQGVEGGSGGGSGNVRVRVLSPVAGRVPERALVLGDMAGGDGSAGGGGGFGALVELLR